MGHYVAIRNQMSNCQDDDLMALARDLFGANSGIRDSGHYEVAENSPVAMTVEVAAGVAYVYSSSLSIHMRTYLDAAVTKTIDANSSGSTRVDLICIKIDIATTADANGSNIATVIVVKGTPGAGAPTTPANYYKLAEVTVVDGETEITDTEISDSRTTFSISGPGISTDTISEKTGAAGVNIDSVRLKDGNVQLKADGNIKEGTATPYKTIYLPAGVLEPTTTSGCAAVATIEAATNDIDYKVLDFATDADENAFCNFQMPGNWDAGVIQFRFVWTNAGGGAAETVTFELSGRSYANDDAIDQAVGTAIEVEDTWIAQGDIHYSPWSGDVTLAGTPAAGEWLHLEVMRDVSEDNLAGDCRILGIQLRYKEESYNHW